MSARFGPDELIACYRRGVFPMAESRDASELFLVDPDWRGVLPIDRFHAPRRLRRTVRGTDLNVVANQDFAAVVRACAESRPGREETWINPSIVSLYSTLHSRGQAHSVEVRDGENTLVGGLYGVALGGAFFGESMFSRVTDASKIALVHLVARLKLGGFLLLDAQFWTKHLDQFGMEQMPRWRFKRELERALSAHADFTRAPAALSGDQALQSIAQTS
jgi:leucyl/phenylalanyl-tRNA--protein transferase